MVRKKPFGQRLIDAYYRGLSDGQVLDLVYVRVEELWKEVDKYMTDPNTLYNKEEYAEMHGRLHVIEEIQLILKRSEEEENA